MTKNIAKIRCFEDWNNIFLYQRLSEDTVCRQIWSADCGNTAEEAEMFCKEKAKGSQQWRNTSFAGGEWTVELRSTQK